MIFILFADCRKSSFGLRMQLFLNKSKMENIYNDNTLRKYEIKGQLIFYEHMEKSQLINMSRIFKVIEHIRNIN